MADPDPVLSGGGGGGRGEAAYFLGLPAFLPSAIFLFYPIEVGPSQYPPLLLTRFPRDTIMAFLIYFWSI